MLKEIWEIQLVQDIVYTLGFIGAVWVVVKVVLVQFIRVMEKEVLLTTWSKPFKIATVK